MEAALLIVALLIVTALALAFGPPNLGRRASRTVVIERPVGASHTRVRRVVRSEPVVEEVIEERH